ncbi:MAG: hypothetical protein JNL12_15000 [Planctomycetes bacterium]|nr:hypothetical protein [Planctomycetota bacterium]
MTVYRSHATLPFVVALVLAGPVPAQQVTLTEALYPGAVAGDRGPLLTRLVDDLTGEPLAAAEVFLIAESKTPLAGEFWWTHRGTSDADGFVRIDRPKGNRDWHIAVVKHPRTGVAVVPLTNGRVARVGRGQDVPLRIVDWLGRPAGGAKVGFCGYCGHTPDIANATADAAGLAVLRGIDAHQGIADFYVQHPGLHIFYETLDWRPGDPPALVECGYGPAQRGRVLDHRGTPVADAMVCGGGLHRGPWARTGADGAFTILGAEPDDSPHKVVLPNGREITFSAPAGVDVVLQLPDLADPDAYDGTCSPSRETAPASPAPAVQHRRVVVQGAPAGPVLLSAWFPGCTEDSTQEAEGDVLVPVRGPFVVRVHAGEEGSKAEREFPFPDGASGDGPLRVQWLPSPRVRGVLVDDAGKPCAGRVRIGGVDGEGLEVGSDGRFELVRGEAGWCSIVVRAADSPDWRCRHLRVGEPGTGDLELGSVPVAGPARLVVVDGGGAVPEGAKVGFVRAGWFEADDPSWWPLQQDGGWHGADPREGDAIVVERDGCVTLRTVLAGAGPWRIELPDARAELEVVDDQGQALAATVVVGDHWQEQAPERGRVALRGMRPGRQRVFVGAPGRRSAIVDVDFGAEPSAPRKVVLPAR